MAESSDATPAAAERGNAEGEELAVPLPAEWDLETLRTLSVTLYGQKISPPCCKMRFLLGFYKIPFTNHDGRKPNSEYKKMPVLDIADRQINDSFVMVKSLAPILQGRPLTEDEVEMEREVTFGLMIAAEKHTAGSMHDLCNCAGLMGGMMGCVLRSCSCCISCCMSGKVGQGKDLKPISEYGSMLQKKLGSKDYFSGSDEPGVLDVSLFGVLTPWARIHSRAMEELQGGAGQPLDAWHGRMQAKSQHVKDIFA